MYTTGPIIGLNQEEIVSNYVLADVAKAAALIFVSLLALTTLHP
jgi:hypothetical protein